MILANSGKASEAPQSAFALADYSTAGAHLRAATLARAGRELPDDFSLIALDFRQPGIKLLQLPKQVKTPHD